MDDASDFFGGVHHLANFPRKGLELIWSWKLSAHQEIRGLFEGAVGDEFNDVDATIVKRTPRAVDPTNRRFIDDKIV